MKWLSLCILCSCFLVSPAQENLFERLVANMQGSFSSADQAKSDTNYFDIELEMKRIWPANKNGVWLYIEQAVASKKDKPYRQRIYHVQEVNDSTFTSTMYKIKGGKTWYGAYKTPERFTALPMDSIELIPGCAITLRPIDGHFKGSTNERDCVNAWGKATYATSEVEMFSDHLVSWDRGWNDAGEHVWGAENGGYIFMKKANEEVALSDFLSKELGYNVDLTKPAEGCFARTADEAGIVVLKLRLNSKGEVIDSVLEPNKSNTTSQYLLNLAKADVAKMKFEKFARGLTEVKYCYQVQ